nr:major histocompatibility complex class I-related gene protein-like [Nerophis lumbriciformis]
MKMFVIFLVFLNYAPFISNTETHSLMYIYTGLSQGALRLPGAREFTAMGVLDGQVIDYYDSGVEKKVPKQAWMESQMSANYWKQGSLSRRSKQEWFRVNVDILLQRMGHNRSDVHVLQWRHGCRGDLRPDGAVAFRGGVDSYSYDGSDFLSFHHERSEWVATAAAAQETKRKWDDVPNLKDYTRAYLDKECVTWMSRFLGYRSDRARPPPPPSVVMFAKKTRSESGTALLSCHASGFPFKDVSLEIRRDGRTLLAEDGVASTGVRPNHDWTFQRRDGVEVLQTDRARFTCVLRHPPSGLRVETLWDGEVCGRSAVTVATAAGLGATALLVAVSVAVLVWRRCKKDSLTGSGRISDSSLSSDSGVGSAENGAEVRMSTVTDADDPRLTISAPPQHAEKLLTAE